MNEEPVDPIPAIMAAIDQTMKIMPEVARLSKAWFEAFRDEGFTDDQALQLTSNRLDSIS